ncbi:MAG: helix-turn-helix domain-containing protein [Pseudomonadota bacterium]|nr:helix-turn-helix domain-containing protein [Pseudomonadota bacterium]
MDQRAQFIADYLRQTFSTSELCEHYKISRKAGYKWIDRYLTLGPFCITASGIRRRWAHRRWRRF